MGEVKSVPGSFDPEQLDRLWRVVRASLPDLVFLAAPEGEWTSEVARDVTAFEEKLKKIDVPLIRHEIGTYFQGLRRVDPE